MAKILSGEVTLVSKLDTAGNLECIANYQASDGTNTLMGSIQLALTANQGSQIKQFITGVVVPQVKAWEGVV